MYNAPPAFAQAIAEREALFRPSSLSGLAEAATTKQVVHISDFSEHAAYKQGDVGAVRMVELAGARTNLIVPMLKEGEFVGTISIYRQEMHPFTEKQIELVKNFAAQAVIAIENARLLNELRQRTTDLTESLEQQTATSEVLRVISSSPGDLKPVFQAMLENATRICEASFGNLLLPEGDTFRRVASHNAPSNFAAFMAKEPFIHRSRSPSLNRVIETKQTDHIADIAADEPEQAIVKLGGARTLVTVPMLKENELIGAFGIYRQEVRRFTDKQIELVKNFAAQAVIAIENTRLLNELRQSLEQQTATADVLRVISSSPGELQPVYDAMLQNAVRLCDAKFGNIYRWDGDVLNLVATHNTPPALIEARRSSPVRPYPGTVFDQVVTTKGAGSHTRFGNRADLF